MMSKILLSREDFYDTALHEAPPAATAILSRMCRDDLKLSETLIKALLDGISTAQLGWRGDDTVEACVLALGAMLELNDELHVKRLEIALEAPKYGILQRASNTAV